MEQENNKKGPIRSKDNANKGQLFAKTLDRSGGSEREPTHLPSNESAFPNSRRRGKTLFGYGGSYIVSESTRVYDNDSQSWFEY